MGSSQICSSLVWRTGSSVGGEGVALDADGVVRGLVDRTPCQVCIMFPLSVLSVSGQYLVAWVCVRLSHEA